MIDVWTNYDTLRPARQGEEIHRITCTRSRPSYTYHSPWMTERELHRLVTAYGCEGYTIESMVVP